MRTLSFALFSLASAAPLAAQADILGFDFRNDRTFRSTTSSFVDDYTPLASVAIDFFALDLNATATRLYAISTAPNRVFTIDMTTGLLSSPGPIVTGIFNGGPNGIVTGLTASPDGQTWWLSRAAGSFTDIHSGDVETGIFTFVRRVDGETLIDIAMDSEGNLFGLSSSNDRLVRIPTGPGSVTVVGPVNYPVEFAQGMDFDWDDDTLYATLYSGGGVGAFATLDTNSGIATIVEPTTSLDAEMEMAVVTFVDVDVGETYCDAIPNSTATTGSLTGFGSPRIADGSVELTAAQLPLNSFGYFLCSRVSGFVANPGGSQGNLCLAGSIGRYVGPGEIKSSGLAGSFSLDVSAGSLPQPTGPISAVSGETWYFQAWHRDGVGGAPTSNFTRGLSIEFL
ncbi:MAG: hypothetical protein AAF726_10130 [Planctomycetota bacterium]